jgi:hypothetical protein
MPAVLGILLLPKAFVLVRSHPRTSLSPSAYTYTMSPEKVENVYGCCPVCGMNDGYVNLGDEHWFYCWEHKKRWKLGAEWFTPIRSKGDGTTSAEEALAAYEPVPLRMTWPD